MIGKVRLFGLLALSAAVAGCGSAQEKDDGLDIERADAGGGLRGTTVVDGEEITVETQMVIASAEGPAGERLEETLVATVTGEDDVRHAEWRLHVLSDRLTGQFAGHDFGPEPEGAARRDGFDWAQLAGSRTGAVLTAVSLRAAGAMGNPDLAPVELDLFTVADMGPYLQALPTIIDGIDALCGDGVCSVDETDGNCPEDCGCAAESACGGVAPLGCYCGAGCAENGDCCVDACRTCGAGCPPCGEATPCEGTCANALNTCDGATDCTSGEDEARCGGGACRAGQMACESGACIEFHQFCDGTNDCPGGEDEACECAYCTPG
jgi:hypothetical protein